MSFPSVESIVYRNNQAVASLLQHEDGHYKESLGLIQRALTDLRKVLGNDNDELLGQEPEGSCQCHASASASVQVQTKSLQCPNNEAGIFCFFDRVLSIQSVAGNPRDYLQQVGAVLMFNLGCLTHAYAILRGNSASLRKARVFYDTSLSMIGDLYESSSDKMTETFTTSTGTSTSTSHQHHY